MSRYLSARYQTLARYVPGEQPQDKKYIKLNTNESPYPPSPEVLASIGEKELSDLRLYSDPECKVLRAKLAERYGVTADQVYLSNGSDDILNFAFMAYASDGGKVAFPDITYGFYQVYADLYRSDAMVIPLKEDFTIDHTQYLRLGRMIVLANPNAPTGLALSLSQIEEILLTNPDNIVLIDEAYVDFGAESAVSLIGKYPNLLVTGTFSKSRSLAGARLGFGIASPEIIRDLNTIKYSTNPYNVNRVTAAMGVGALMDTDYFEDNCRKIIAAREYTASALAALGFDLTPSVSNFLFAKSDKIDGERLYLLLKERGVLVRHFSGERISEYNRITIGSMEQMQTFIDIIKDIMENLV